MSIMKVNKTSIIVFVGINIMTHHPLVEFQEHKHIDILKWWYLRVYFRVLGHCFRKTCFGKEAFCGFTFDWKGRCLAA